MSTQRELDKIARTEEAEQSSVEQPMSRVQQMQSRMGNAQLLQMRSAVQARSTAEPIQTEGAPDWIKSQLGIGAAEESNHDRVTQARETAAEQASSMTLPSGGEKLDAPIQKHAEEHLGVPLGDVNVVKGADAACDSMGAMAFASGNDVFLSSSVDTNSEDGKFTMAHELAHVAQQKKGETSGLEGLGGDETKRTDLENSADSAASKMLR
jgi:hypothetical protein